MKHQDRTEISVRRRSCIAAIAATGIGGLAGCLDVIAGDEPYEAEASPARVSEETISETGYERVEQEPIVIEREVEVADRTREIVVTNWLTEYEQTVNLGILGEQEAAVFAVVTSPEISFVGREFNPIAEMTAEELVELVQDQYDEVQDLTHEAEHETTVYRDETTESVFSGEATYEGQQFDIRLHVTEAVPMNDDFVVTIGAYPEEFAEEEENIRQLATSVEPDN